MRKHFSDSRLTHDRKCRPATVSRSVGTQKTYALLKDPTTLSGLFTCRGPQLWERPESRFVCPVIRLTNSAALPCVSGEFRVAWHKRWSGIRVSALGNRLGGN